MLRYFFSFLLSILLAFSVMGQRDSLYVKDSTKKLSTIIPKIRIGADVSRLFLSATRSDFKGFEGSVDANFGQHIFECHAGFASHRQRLETYTPISSGPYISIGYGKNVFSESDNILSLGGRIAGSSFNFQPTQVKMIDAYSQIEKIQDLEKKNSRVIWAELVTAIRAKIFGWVLMGFELRLKGRLHAKAEGFQPYSVPGYGFYSGKTSIGFNYFVFINLPTKKSK